MRKRFTASDWSIPEAISAGKIWCMAIMAMVAIGSVYAVSSAISMADSSMDSIYVLEDGMAIKADRNPEAASLVEAFEDAGEQTQATPSPDEPDKEAAEAGSSHEVELY